MTAWLKFVPAWAWWALALVVVAGGQQVRVVWAQDVAEKAQAELLEASETLGACRATRTTLLGQVIEQNSALADLRAAEQERAARARDVQLQAEGLAQHADQQAQQVLQERTPAGVDACAAASAAFDDELRRERAQ